MYGEILTVREMQLTDIPLIAFYWLDADDAYLRDMGVDVAKRPVRDQFYSFLEEQVNAPDTQKKSYCIIWEADGQPVGHSNTSPIIFGEEAFMHLHLWKSDARQKGWGTQFVCMTLPWYFEKLQLKTLYCQPYALNPSPHRTLEKAGFRLQEELFIAPSPMCFKQQVKRWHMSREMFRSKSVSREW